jgi:hypothetical protein
MESEEDVLEEAVVILDWPFSGAVSDIEEDILTRYPHPGKPPGMRSDTRLI